MGEPCPAPLRVAMRSPLPFPCVPDRPYKILLAQVGTLSFSHPLFGVSVLFIYLWSDSLNTYFTYSNRESTPPRAVFYPYWQYSGRIPHVFQNTYSKRGPKMDVFRSPLHTVTRTVIEDRHEN